MKIYNAVQTEEKAIEILQAWLTSITKCILREEIKWMFTLMKATL